MKVLDQLLVLSVVSNLPSADSDDSKVVGGFAADLSNMPFTTSIQSEERHFCGGALFSMSLVLTGCHCMVAALTPGTNHDELTIRDAARLSAVVGSENLFDGTSQYYQRKSIREIKVHPNCSYITFLVYDYSVAYLESPFQSSVKVKPFTMFSTNKDTLNTKIRELVNNERSYCYVAGWGAVDPDVRKANDFLKAARKRLISDQECRILLAAQNSKYGSHDFEEAGMVCSLSFDEKNESDCVGDSGGPFFCGASVYGLVSYGFKCGQAKVPNIYAKMSCAVEWLSSLGLYDESFRSRRITSSQSGGSQKAILSRIMLVVFFTIKS